jgi:hypothetical protein
VPLTHAGIPFEEVQLKFTDTATWSASAWSPTRKVPVHGSTISGMGSLHLRDGGGDVSQMRLWPARPRAAFASVTPDARGFADLRKAMPLNIRLVLRQGNRHDSPRHRTRAVDLESCRERSARAGACSAISAAPTPCSRR